jgi:hypothetical protein
MNTLSELLPGLEKQTILSFLLQTNSNPFINFVKTKIYGSAD